MVSAGANPDAFISMMVIPLTSRLRSRKKTDGHTLRLERVTHSFLWKLKVEPHLARINSNATGFSCRNLVSPILAWYF